MASRLNALHTLPAPLAPASGLLARGKSLVSFYKTGIVNVWHNRRNAAQIRQQYGCTSALNLSKSIIENHHLNGIAHQVEKSRPEPKTAVKRDELLTLLRTERDLRKLPLFAVVFAICFELTPVVLWGFPRIAPSTCWSAGFNQKLRATYTHNLSELHKLGTFDGSESVYKLEQPVLRQLASVLDFGHHYRVLPHSLLARRVMDHLTYVRADDVILRQSADQLHSLHEEELQRALMMRALPLDGGVDALKKWIEEFKEPMDAGYFLK